ncbi:hypothetical protein ACFJIX_16800 [Roseateles sp. UC29_93]|uniref:hypothetical protein n=1 Tax=Roseateles sp. UC29_93 TaxID=3350177 RepID=UPI00366F8591
MSASNGPCAKLGVSPRAQAAKRRNTSATTASAGSATPDAIMRGEAKRARSVYAACVSAPPGTLPAGVPSPITARRCASYQRGRRRQASRGSSTRRPSRSTATPGWTLISSTCVGDAGRCRTSRPASVPGPATKASARARRPR